MRSSLKPTVLVLAAVLAAVIVAGCGGSSGGGGGGAPATLAPERAPVYLEVELGPEGSTSDELNELAKNVFGVENVREFVAEELEKAALGEGEKLNFEEEVEPWLGSKAGMYLTGYDGDNFTGYGVALETTNSGEAEEFVEKRVEAGDEKVEEGEVEGHKYYVEPEDESVIGVIGDFLAFGQTKANFEEMVKISEGDENLSESEKFKTAMEAVESDALGSVYVDIGALIAEGKGVIPAESEAIFEAVGIEPKQATAVATVIPHAEQVELNFSSTVGKSVPTGDGTETLEGLPATAIAAFASPEVGKVLGEEIDALNEEGIPGQIPAGELKPALEAVGINLDAIAESIGNVGGFVEGSSQANLGGAIVVDTTSAGEAKKLVGNIGLLLRVTGTKGVTAIGGEVTGFSVHSSELGKQPLIIGASAEKLVISYGTKAAAQALRTNAKTLGTTADFEAAKASLGSTPMESFVDGGPTLRLVESLISTEEQAELAQARPYLQKVSYIAVGSEAKGEATNAKVIVGLQK